MEIVGVGEREDGDYGVGTGYTQVGGGPCVEAGDAGNETGDTQARKGPCAGAGVGDKEGLGVS